MATEDPAVKTWRKRIDAGEKLVEKWERENRVHECYCVGPDTRVLTYDMRWVPASTVETGDALVGFDEYTNTPTGRYWRKAVVESAGRITLPSYRLTFEDGTTVVASAEHLWLTKTSHAAANRKWKRTTELKDVMVLKPLEPWVEDLSHGAGYLAAAFEGEGSLSYLSAPHSDGAFAIRFGQRDNVMLERVKNELTSRGFGYGTTSGDVINLTVSGGLRENMRFLGSVRPQRLIEKLTKGFGHFRCRKYVRLVNSEFLGDVELVALGTSTKTFIAEGLASHNSYWRGNQLVQEKDEFGQRRAQINKIHPEVRNNIPSIYYYRPFARIVAAPEQADDPGTEVEQDTQLLQDTVNHLIRDPRTMFRASTLLGLKEAHWSMGVVEVGYSAEFDDTPYAPRVPLKEKKDTKVPPPAKPPKADLAAAASAAVVSSLLNTTAPAGPLSLLPGAQAGLAAPEPSPTMGNPLGMPPAPSAPLAPEETAPPAMPAPGGLEAIQAEIDTLRGQLRQEMFFVKHIPANRVLISPSDMPILESNDWIGYWEDMPLEDVKRCKAYTTTGLKASDAEDKLKDRTPSADDDTEVEKVRLYKLWDLRTHTRIVMAKGYDKFLLREPYERCGLKFLRFDIDPYHFLPRPLILSKLGPQDEYNDSREYLRKIRKGTVPRYTYDEDGIDPKDLRKLESGAMGTYVPRKTGTTNVIEPVQQPSYSENAIQTLTLSDKEFQDVGGVGSDARVAQTKTATQAKIAEVKEQTQDNFDRLVVAEWLSDIARELLALAIEKMNVDQWIAVNVVPDSQFTAQIAQQVAGSFARINATSLSDASRGIIWDVMIDIESMSPVSEEEKFQKLMQGLQLMANPPMARLFSVSPELLKYTLQSMGIKSGREIGLITGAVQQVVQMEQMLAAASQNAAPGISPMPGANKPGAPVSGGPQPGGPTGPGASTPKPPAPPSAPRPA